MSAPVELIVAAFKNSQKADLALKSLKELEKEGVIRLLNAAVLKKDDHGIVSIHETQDIHAGQGAIFGAIVGGLIGLLGGPAGVIVGAAAGAATGGVAADRIDMGFPDENSARIKTDPDAEFISDPGSDPARMGRARSCRDGRIRGGFIQRRTKS